MVSGDIAWGHSNVGYVSTCALFSLVPKKKNEMKGVLGHDSALVRLYWAGDNLGY